MIQPSILQVEESSNFTFKPLLMRKFILPLISFLLIIATNNSANAQQYKLRQSTNIMTMKSETTIYVKGMRKRTETAGMMGMSAPISIEQCDLQRTIKLNDKKNYFS